MTDFQQLFLVQARSDFVVFELLLKHSQLPDCHALHHLQLATELLGKAQAWRDVKNSDDAKRLMTHRAFVRFLRNLSTNRKAQRQLGYEGKNANWRHLIRKSVPLAEEIEDLAPNNAQLGPNSEYPWPPLAPLSAPAIHTFEISQKLKETTAGRRFIALLRKLFETAQEYL